MADTREPVRVAIAVVRRGDQVLVGTRREKQPLGGMAEFPGGKCGEGESAEACVVREVLEETGLVVTVVGLRGVVNHDYPHGPVRLAFFDCVPANDGEPHPPFGWVDVGELGRLRFPEANREIIEALAGTNVDSPRPRSP